MPDLASPLAVVCHDAGAANLILPWLDLDRARVQAFMQGPASQLWRQRFGERGLVPTLDAALAGARMLVSGTGWATDIEHDARVLASTRGIRTVAVVDHWVNYTARFVRDGHRELPQEIWVTDAEAMALARQCFPGHDIRLYPNLYLQAQIERMAPCPDPARHGDVLYVAEPARSDWGRGEPGEFQALDFFMAERHRLGQPAGGALILRPHPSDPKGKYDEWIARQAQRNIWLDDAPTLADAIDEHAWVAGCETMAMVVALAGGRRVVCTLPPWAPPCRLPQRGLIHLKDLAGSAKSAA